MCFSPIAFLPCNFMVLPCRVHFSGNAFKPFTVSLTVLSKSVLSRSNLIGSWCYRKNSAGVLWEAECSADLYKNRKFCKAVPLGSKSFRLWSLFEYLHKEFWWDIWSGIRSNRDCMDQWFFFSFRNAWLRTLLKMLCFVSLGTCTQSCLMFPCNHSKRWLLNLFLRVWTTCHVFWNKEQVQKIIDMPQNWAFFFWEEYFHHSYGIRVISAFSG